MVQSISWAAVACSLFGLHLVGAESIETREVSMSTDIGTQLRFVSHYSSLSGIVSSHKPGTKGKLSRRSAAYLTGYGSEDLTAYGGQIEWAIEVEFGNQKLPLILDTGSSDTWTVSKGFECIGLDQTGNYVQVPEYECAFGPLYKSGFTKNQLLGGVNFNIHYGGGEFLHGSLGLLDVTVAGITVGGQVVALANETYWDGNNLTSGILGLAYPTLTSRYWGTNYTLDNSSATGFGDPGTPDPYDPLLFSMMELGLVNPGLFSLALQRSPQAPLSGGNSTPGGYIAFGGLPPISINPDFVKTPVVIHQYWHSPALWAKKRSYYSIRPDGYVYRDAHGYSAPKLHKESHAAVVDSGTTLLYLPVPVYRGYIASFPPNLPFYDDGNDVFVPCGSTLPELGISIAGRTFYIDSRDLIFQDDNYMNGTVPFCFVGIQHTGYSYEELPILGSIFLKNVVAVFNVQENEILFTEHIY